MDIKFRNIENKFTRYDYVQTAIDWDKKRTFNQDGRIGSDWLFENMICAFCEEELVGIGEINVFYESNEKKARLAVITRPEYRNQGIADKLIKVMLYYCKEGLHVSTVVANILDTNKYSLAKAEKNEFELIAANGSILTFEKKLIIKQ